MDLHCAVCGTLFTPKDREQRLCSWQCRGKWAANVRPPRTAVERSCSNECGRTVLTKGRNLAYCPECRSPERSCRQCGTAFRKVDRRSRFCSVSCRSKYAGRLAPIGEAHWNWKGVGAPYGTHAWHRRRDEVRKRDGWRCVDCGKQPPEVGKLNAHHLVSRDDWGDQSGHPDDATNLVTVCTGCHTRRHGAPEDLLAERRRQRARAYYQAHRVEKIAYAVAYQREHRDKR